MSDQDTINCEDDLVDSWSDADLRKAIGTPHGETQVIRALAARLARAAAEGGDVDALITLTDVSGTLDSLGELVRTLVTANCADHLDDPDDPQAREEFNKTLNHLYEAQRGVYDIDRGWDLISTTPRSPRCSPGARRRFTRLDDDRAARRPGQNPHKRPARSQQHAG